MSAQFAIVLPSASTVPAGPGGGDGPAADAASEKIRFSAKSVAAQRKRLGISAADFGKLIGVSGQTVYAWEQGVSRPRKAQLAAFVAIRGVGKTEAKARLEQLGAKSASGRKRKG